MSQGRDLPPELSEHILDFLHDDHEALKACALACRALRIPCHARLFSEVHVPEALLTTRFAELLEHSATVPALIRILSIDAYKPPKQSIDPLKLVAVLDRLGPALHTVRLSGVLVSPFVPDAVTHAPERRLRRRELKVLEIRNYMMSTASFAQMASIFSTVNVGVLRVDCSVCAPSVIASTEELCQAYRLKDWRVRKLHLGKNPCTTNACLLEFALFATEPRSLSALNIVQRDTSNAGFWGTLSSFLLARSPYIKSLRVDVSGAQSDPSHATWECLAYLKSLETLHVYSRCPKEVHSKREDRTTEDTIEPFAAFILPHAPRSVRYIVLAVDGDEDEERLSDWMKRTRWKRLESMLLEFEELEEVQVIFETSKQSGRSRRVPRSLQKLITEAMPALHRSSKLTFPRIQRRYEYE